MARTIMLIPTSSNVGLTGVSLGVIRSMERQGVKISLFKPVAQPALGGDRPDQTTTLIQSNTSIPNESCGKVNRSKSARCINGRDYSFVC